MATENPADCTESVPQEAQILGASEHFAAIDGAKWRYLQAGSGPALLLLHGLMGYSFSWRFVMRALSEHFTVYAIDLPGCGFSQRLATLKGSLTSDAEGILKLMDYLQIEEADVVGTSRGGGLSIVLAALTAQQGQPGRIRRMVLAAPVNPWSRFGQLRARLLATMLGGLYVVHVAPRMPALLKSYFEKLYADRSRIPEGSYEGYHAGLVPAGSFEHIRQIMRSWHRDLQQVEASLPDIANLPILLLWGAKDTAVLPSSAYELQKRLNNSAVIMLDDVAHMPYEEVPDEFNRIVLDFLLRHRPATPLEADETANLTAVSAAAEDDVPPQASKDLGRR